MKDWFMGPDGPADEDDEGKEYNIPVSITYQGVKKVIAPNYGSAFVKAQREAVDDEGQPNLTEVSEIKVSARGSS